MDVLMWLARPAKCLTYRGIQRHNFAIHTGDGGRGFSRPSDTQDAASTGNDDERLACIAALCFYVGKLRARQGMGASRYVGSVGEFAVRMLRCAGCICLVCASRR